MSLCIYFEDQRAPGHFLRQGFDFGGGHAAGAAPAGPEIHQNRHLGFLNDGQEIGAIGDDGFRCGLQRRLAGSAATGIGQMLGRDAVVRAAGGATGDSGVRHGMG